MNLANIITDKDGTVSTSKIWRQIAFGVATYIVIVNAIGINWELLLTYMAVVSGSEIAKAVVLQRAGIISTTSTSTVVKSTTPVPIVKNEGE